MGLGMSSKKNTKHEIMCRAKQLLLSRGFNGFSYKDIAQKLGIKNAAIHYHFPCKADLGRSLIEDQLLAFRQRVAQAKAANTSNKMQVEAYFRWIKDSHENPGNLCHIGAVVADFDQLTEDMRKLCSQLIEEFQAWLADTLERGRELGEFKFSGDASAKAIDIIASIQGARQLSRVTGADTLKTVVQSIRSELYRGSV